MLISFKDWIAGKHHLSDRNKNLQEDILSDDGFPDTTERYEMFEYLKRQNASNKYLNAFSVNFKKYQREVLYRYSHDHTTRKRGNTHERSRLDTNY